MENQFQFIEGGVTAPKGFKAGAIKAKIKYDKKDVAVIYSEVPANAAGVFTTNKFKAAPVILSTKHLENGIARAIVVNSGCANACTGEKGMGTAVQMAERTATALNISVEDIIVASTGVIGKDLPMEKILPGIDEAVAVLSETGSYDAAEAIMTTDTAIKEVAVQFELNGVPVTIGGIAKGSGMIKPNMATMLGFMTTDAAISKPLLKKALKDVADQTFNMVTVDGDTSTNDSLVILANGLANNQEIAKEDAAYNLFVAALTQVCEALAKAIARDGEGATKLVEVRVESAMSVPEARKVAMAIAESNLVKTAIFGHDANWGRIICAVGYSGAEIEAEKVEVYLGRVKVAENGMGIDFDEDQAKKVLEENTVIITVKLNQGNEGAVAWTCDLSYEYIRINADYRT